MWETQLQHASLCSSVKLKADFQLSVVPNSRNSRQVKLVSATCGSPKVPMPDVCSVSAAGPRTSLSAIHIKQCKENMCFFGKQLKVVLLALAGEGRSSGEQVFCTAPTWE